MHALLVALVVSVVPTSPELQPIFDQVKKQHGANVERLRKWVAVPSIAAENRNAAEGVKLMMALATEAGFTKVSAIDTGGKQAVFGVLEAGAPKTVGLYFMYDVKQFDPAEWANPPLEGRLVDRPNVGKVLVGRGAVNQKGPQSALLAALIAIKAAGKKPPVNLVLVAEGEEEIGSPHFKKAIEDPRVNAALKKAIGVFMPSASQGTGGEVEVSLGAKGVVELELVSSGERWGRGPGRDVHSANRARLDSPAFHLVQALNTLVDANGDPAIEGFATKARPLSAQENAMLDIAAKNSKEEDDKAQMQVKVWAHDAGWREAMGDLVSRPTVNIEGLVGGYTGPGGKTMLPHRAVAKLDLRLVPDMTFDSAVAALKAHLAKRGFGDIEVNVSGGYGPTATAASAEVIQKEIATYQAFGLSPSLWPRNAGSYPGYVFTDPPLSLPAAHFGLGHGDGAHAPNEFFLIESTNPKIAGYDEAVMSYVHYLYELAR